MMNALIKFICEICQCFEEICFFFILVQMNERMREKEKHDSDEKKNPTILFELYGKFRHFYIGVNEFRKRIVSVEIK